MGRSIAGRCGVVVLWLIGLAFATGSKADLLEHSGPILEDTVWRSSDEHLIVGDGTVYPQVILTIEAGTTVRFAAGSDNTAGGSDLLRSELIVNGALLAQGTANQPVVITSKVATPAANDWGGMRFDSRYPFVLRHTIVETGNVGGDLKGGAGATSVTIRAPSRTPELSNTSRLAGWPMVLGLGCFGSPGRWG